MKEYSVYIVVPPFLQSVNSDCIFYAKRAEWTVCIKSLKSLSAFRLALIWSQYALNSAYLSHLPWQPIERLGQFLQGADIVLASYNPIFNRFETRLNFLKKSLFKIYKNILME